MYLYKNTNISILQGDITKLKVDAIVNAANSTLLGGGGVDGAIHRAGGRMILEECRKIGGCPTGEARITTAGELPSKYVIHTVGPIYRGGKNNEARLLYNAYFNSLKLVVENKIKTIAFPAISTGVYHYPKDEASDIAIKAVMDFIEEYDQLDRVIFVLFSKGDFELYEKKIKGIFRR
ncbi:O-acetyl-ADP-ribose deacetylase [Crassaminicella profunda]|uniref:O-acetyl-ADP-ribose deacetylase n=1 Tax=Crassaminicella profunda TaxID=1286698 RepID=UPI001CA64CE4|nr:O-acetyl-ADP-ribose deacetylase [Crassaminicella profunda]QZY55618.1 O-acetyl-ADP-ribose deacetylase [Crassaminicella profunda]